MHSVPLLLIEFTAKRSSSWLLLWWGVHGSEGFDPLPQPSPNLNKPGVDFLSIALPPKAIHSLPDSHRQPTLRRGALPQTELNLFFRRDFLGGIFPWGHYYYSLLPNQKQKFHHYLPPNYIFSHMHVHIWDYLTQFPRFTGRDWNPKASSCIWHPTTYRGHLPFVL